MYKIFKAGEKEYKLEYTIEASLYDECIEKLFDFMGKIYGTQSTADFYADLPEEQRLEALKGSLMGGLSALANVPSTAFTFLYAGLLEHHGIGRNGDKSVRSKEDAKDIIRDYFDDHADDGKNTFYDILVMCMEQMSEDNFFERTGLEKMVHTEEQPENKRAPKVPQDHKKPSAK